MMKSERLLIPPAHHVMTSSLHIFPTNPSAGGRTWNDTSTLSVCRTSSASSHDISKMTAQQERILKAKCACGTIQHEMFLPQAAFPIDGCHCHCTSCRQMSGGLCFTSIPLLSEDEYQPKEEIRQKLSGFEFSKDRITHYFCPVCGMHMLARVLPKDRNITVATWFATCGSLIDAENVYHPQHEYVEDTIDGGITNTLQFVNNKLVTRWASHPKEARQLPLYWVSPIRPSLSSLPADKLYARCKCHGVEFWITLPANGSKTKVKLGHQSSHRLENGMEPYATATFEVASDRILLDESGLRSYPLCPDFGTLKTWRSSAEAMKKFCGVCGASVFLISEDESRLEVSVGILVAPEGVRAETWLEWPPEYSESLE